MGVPKGKSNGGRLEEMRAEAAARARTLDRPGRRGAAEMASEVVVAMR